MYNWTAGRIRMIACVYVRNVWRPQAGHMGGMKASGLLSAKSAPNGRVLKQ